MKRNNKISNKQNQKIIFKQESIENWKKNSFSKEESKISILESLLISEDIEGIELFKKVFKNDVDFILKKCFQQKIVLKLSAYSVTLNKYFKQNNYVKNIFSYQITEDNLQNKNLSQIRQKFFKSACEENILYCEQEIKFKTTLFKFLCGEQSDQYKLYGSLINIFELLAKEKETSSHVLTQYKKLMDCCETRKHLEEKIIAEAVNTKNYHFLACFFLDLFETNDSKDSLKYLIKAFELVENKGDYINLEKKSKICFSMLRELGIFSNLQQKFYLELISKYRPDLKYICQTIEGLEDEYISRIKTDKISDLFYKKPTLDESASEYKIIDNLKDYQNSKNPENLLNDAKKMIQKTSKVGFLYETFVLLMLEDKAANAVATSSLIKMIEVMKKVPAKYQDLDSFAYLYLTNAIKILLCDVYATKDLNSINSVFEHLKAIHDGRLDTSYEIRDHLKSLVSLKENIEKLLKLESTSQEGDIKPNIINDNNKKNIKKKDKKIKEKQIKSNDEKIDIKEIKIEQKKTSSPEKKPFSFSEVQFLIDTDNFQLIDQPSLGKYFSILKKKLLSNKPKNVNIENLDDDNICWKVKQKSGNQHDYVYKKNKDNKDSVEVTKINKIINGNKKNNDHIAENYYAAISPKIAKKLEGNIFDNCQKALSSGVKFIKNDAKSIIELWIKEDLRLFTDTIFKNQDGKSLIVFNKMGNHSTIKNKLSTLHFIELIDNSEHSYSNSSDESQITGDYQDS